MYSNVQKNNERHLALTDDVRHVLAVAEPPRRAVVRRVDAVRRRVGARRRDQEVVVAVVHQGVAEHEEGAGRVHGGRRSQQAQHGEEEGEPAGGGHGDCVLYRRNPFDRSVHLQLAAPWRPFYSAR
jgi:hypothetical protein